MQSAAKGVGPTAVPADTDETQAAPATTEISRAAALAQAAIIHTRLAAQDVVETLAGAIDDTAAGDDSLLQGLLASARRVNDSATTAGRPGPGCGR